MGSSASMFELKKFMG